MSNDPTLPLPQRPRSRQPRSRQRPARGPVIVLLSLLVLLMALVIADRVGNSIAENDFATQAQQSGLPVRPSVDITGFPFLTQLAARDFHQIDITANNVPAGPLSIASISVTATGVRPTSSFNGATVDHITGTGLVTFGALTNAGTGGDGSDIVSMTAAGPDRVRISAGPVSEEARVVRTRPDTISVQMVDSGDLLSGFISSFGSFSFTVPKLPGRMQVTSLLVTSRGVVLSFAASHTRLTQ